MQDKIYIVLIAIIIAVLAALCYVFRNLIKDNRNKAWLKILYGVCFALGLLLARFLVRGI